MKKFITYFITVVLLIVVTFVILANVITIGEKLRGIYPALEILFYALSFIVFYFFILSPVLTVLFSPNYSISRYCDEDDNNNHGLKTRAKKLLKNGNLEEKDAQSLKDAITTKDGNQKVRLSQRMYILYNNQIKQNIDKIVVDTAKDTMVLTAVSQNGFIDMMVVLSNNFRMIKKIVVMCGFRPTFLRTVKLYANVFFSSLIADGAQKLEMSSLISSSITGVGKILTDSLANGAMNALFTLRIGMLTKQYLYADDIKKNKVQLRNSALAEACKLFPSVIVAIVTSPIKSVANLIRKNDEIETEQTDEEITEKVKWNWRLKKEKKE